MANEKECGSVHGVYSRLQSLIARFLSKNWRFLEKAWKLGASEPRKVIHCLKVGVALSLVSLFYYMRPLYDGVGGTAMWAVMTVVVVFEYTVGATLYKCINRATGTFLAGSLGIGVHWVASQSGEKFEPIIAGIPVFLLASAATFSRFIPSIKARFDYGAMIFILTFSLVSVAGYRVEKLFEMAHNRVSTIVLGTSICICTSMLICPVWAGNELHLLINRNMEKLADSLEGCVAECFNRDGIVKTSDDDFSKKLQGYKFALNSKASEESMANFARWEPAHGPFNFRHPWKQYLKIGAAMRNCSCCVESLSSCINSEIQIPKFLKKNFSEVCMRLSAHCSEVLKEMVVTMKTMTKSSTTDLLVEEMNFAVQELQNALKALPNQLISPHGSANDTKVETTSKQFIVPVIEIVPLATTISLLSEIAARIEGIVDAVEDLADLAEFKPATDNKPKQSQCVMDKTDDETMKVLQKV
ncbi:Aluminum-activated malate transporter like [Actinidia chinensis var. chinensis]|uniref:Aluminum-activated malate transporter like n=1 Tax=Actinidia chinensis var. chinensis TaxID=1590841 RepID=A0A2R6Q7N1_ACTCC|nr:Aluminum-activated malate transporter like [Actinidia chinensis var. chinensis]